MLPILFFPESGWCKELKASYYQGPYRPKREDELKALLPYASNKDDVIMQLRASEDNPGPDEKNQDDDPEDIVDLTAGPEEEEPESDEGPDEDPEEVLDEGPDDEGPEDG